jgi:hypothetical protein
MSLWDFFGRKPTVERLARDIVAAAAAIGEPGWRFEPSTQSLLKDGSDATVHLANVFLEYSQAPKSQRRALLEKYATLLTTLGREIPKLWTLARKNVYAVVRSRHDMAALEIANRGKDRQLVQRVEYPWHGDLAVRIAYDFGPSMGQVDTTVADTWSVSREELLETAKRNLRALPKPEWRRVAAGVLQLASAASYEESMLLRDDVWDGLPVTGDVVAIAPNRGVLLVAGGGDASALEALLGEARRCLEQKPWPLDPVILIRHNGGWVRTSLPETDFLAFNKNRGEGKFDTLVVPWAEAKRVCGARMTAEPGHPPRWSVATFPGPEEWQALAAAQVKP